MRKLLLFMACAILCVGIVGCGKSSGEKKPNKDTSSAVDSKEENQKEEEKECSHSWSDANCTVAKTCSLCGKTEGEALGHQWSDANCTTAKTCSRCNATEGSALGHAWSNATCTTAKTCSRCSATEGAALGHSVNGATVTCNNCGKAMQSADFAYLAASDYRGIKRTYSAAEPIGAYVTSYTDKEGDNCVMVDVWYKIGSKNFHDTFLHNLSTGQRLVDPCSVYEKQSNKSVGATKLKYMNLQIECLDILSKPQNAYSVDAATLGFGT